MNDNIQYTKYFTSCKGVFQGGGCKAIAYIGAYKKAYQRGVFFSELAGTSAGSIIAALIAAGATPNYLEEIVLKLDFQRFISKYNEANCLEKLVAKKVLPQRLSSFNKYFSIKGITKDWGIFDSYEIEKFMESELQKLTGKNDVVTFKDLIPNLHIVCADLGSHSVRIWNKTETPNESVAKAIRCSCSIPIFFQPVDHKYVDGGILSNLPNFIFSKEPNYNRILCFKLISTDISAKIESLDKYLFSLADTIIEGGNDIQQKLLPESFEVPIKVNGISSTDFNRITNEQINSLILNGENAMDDFLNQESTFSHAFSQSSLLDTKEQMHSLVSYISMERHKEIYVSSENTYWCWVLFLSVVRWINNKSQIVIFTSKTINKKYEEEEKSRRRMLEAMGCKIVLVDEITVNGYFFGNNNTWEGIVFRKDSDVGFRAKYYNHIIDNELIKEWICKLKKQIKDSLTIANPISIKQVDQQSIIKMLRNEAVYEFADFNFETIEIEKLSFINPYIRALKYKQIDELFNLYLQNDLIPFSPAALIFGNQKESLIGPPVIEIRDNKYYLIEGNTRCVYAYKHGIKKLQMLVVRGVTAPIPCDTKMEYHVSNILISDREITRKQRYKDFDYTLFRHIEESLRPHETYLI